MARSTQGFDKLLEDVTKLEINTIIKDNMTARKMPDPANALLDIAQAYGWYLVECDVPVRRWLSDNDSPAVSGNPAEELARLKQTNELERWLRIREDGESDGFSSDDVHLDERTFSGLRWAATTAVQERHFGSAKRVVLQRICRNCDHIKNLLGRLKGDPAFEQVQGKTRTSLNAMTTTGYWQRDLIIFAPDDANLVRKIWEIGVEDVLAQATIQLDGDVVNRISSTCLSPDKADILAIHRLGIESAVGYWSKLMEAVGGFIGDLVGLVTGSRR
jgi:hypothetical protein